MGNIKEQMHKVFTKCDLTLNGEVFSKELLVNTFAEFLASTASADEHNVGIVLHTGSVVFDAVAIAYAAISNMLLNETSSDDVVLALSPGDKVLYGTTPKRYVFKEVFVDSDGKRTGGKKGMEYAFLEGIEKGVVSKNFVPKERWKLILPYNGESDCLDGRGIRPKSGIREDFYQEVLDFDSSDIPAVVDTATVLLMSKDRFDHIINDLSFFFNGKEAKLLDLVTASYYTENEEHTYSGNTGKLEPVLKITGKASVARKLIKKRNGSRHIGLIVMGSGTVTKNLTELPELLDRQSLQYVYVSMHIDSDHSQYLLNECPDAHILACTKDFLLSYATYTKVRNSVTKELSRQVDAIIDRRVEPVILQGHFDWGEYKRYKQAMFAIKNSEFTSENKENFVVQAYSLMNLLLTSVFKITELENAIVKGAINVASPSDKFDKLCEYAAEFPGYLREKALEVIQFIENAYLFLTERSEKEERLRCLLQENHNKKVALVVPKAYFATVLRECGFYEIMDDERLLSVSTANQFNNSTVYDLIIVVGDFGGTRFDVFRCRSSQHIITLLYQFESNIFKYKLKKADAAEKELNEKAELDFDMELEYEDMTYESDATSNEVQAVEEITEEIDSYVARLNEIAAIRSLGVASVGGDSGNSKEIVTVVSFESGEKALFTPKYKAYVLDEISGDVNETDVLNLVEGTTLIFTKYDDESHDIVDDILSQLVEGEIVGSNVIECYRKSKRWKSELIRYMRDTGHTPKSIADKMISNRIAVQEGTIRNWLDEDSRMVGPRHAESIMHIAWVIEDGEMFEKYADYFDACNVIRSIRREIRKEIGKAIINKYKGVLPEKGTYLAEIFDRVESLAVLLRVETITKVVHTVPANMTNRPLMIRE